MEPDDTSEGKSQQINEAGEADLAAGGPNASSSPEHHIDNEKIDSSGQQEEDSELMTACVEPVEGLVAEPSSQVVASSQDEPGSLSSSKKYDRRAMQAPLQTAELGKKIAWFVPLHLIFF